MPTSRAEAPDPDAEAEAEDPEAVWVEEALEDLEELEEPEEPAAEEPVAEEPVAEESLADPVAVAEAPEEAPMLPAAARPVAVLHTSMAEASPAYSGHSERML